jgi:hypothetical protein
VEALLASRVAVFPEGVGLPDGGWTTLGRSVHRAWLEAGGRGPLLQLDARHVGSSDDVDAAARALGEGLLHLGPGVPCPRGLPVSVLRHAATTDPRQPHRLDAVHAVAVDPTLARVRAALRAHAQAGEVIYLRGPAGSGRASLARWAAATLGAPSLVEISPDHAAHAPPGAWILLREFEDLGPERLGPLRARLAAPPVRWGSTAPGVRPDHPAVATMVGRDRAFCDVLGTAVLHAPTPAPVLILGESGTGKEPLARLVHDASGRRGPLVAVDLASRNENLLEDDLFGHVPGAFEGARTARDGALRRAHRGTLFLDELGNLPATTQLRLLRVLETGQVQPLGSDTTYAVDVRIVAATNSDMEGLVHSGAFRRDLYHRLAGVVLRLPPLRDRGEDLVLLAEHFAREVGSAGVTPEALEFLRGRPWSGNIRELRSVVEVAAREAHGGPIQPRHVRLESPVPIFVTGSVDVLEHPGALNRREAQALAALGVVVAPPAERGEACIRGAVLAGLGGRPVTPEALWQLVSWPWWGNFVELDRKLRVLRGGPPGLVDVDALAAIFPEAGVSREPIVSLLSPSAREDGSVQGWRATHYDGALVLGRARTRADLDEPRKKWLASRADAPGFMAFPQLMELSRVHALVTRQGDNLVVTSAPGVSLPLLAGPLDGALVPVGTGDSVSIGRAGEVRFQRDAEPLLQLYLFAGEAALAEAAPLLRARLSGDVGETRQGGRVARARALSRDEIGELNAVVVDFARGEGEFAPHLRAALVTSGQAELRALLLSGHPTQSCVRLYLSLYNRPLRRDLVRQLKDAGLVERARERLPTNLRGILDEPDED